MKVFVATYEHHHGRDVSVYATKALAEAVRQEIADEGWDEAFLDAKPDDPHEMADAYFQMMGERDHGEWFTVEECNVVADAEATPTPALDDRELATVLAALRYWQREGWISGGHEHDIATNGDTLEPLGADEIDALCERLNAGAAKGE